MERGHRTAHECVKLCMVLTTSAMQNVSDLVKVSNPRESLRDKRGWPTFGQLCPLSSATRVGPLNYIYNLIHNADTWHIPSPCQFFSYTSSRAVRS